MPSVSLTLFLKSFCEVAPLSLAVCPHATIAPQIWALKWWPKWRIPHLTPRDRSVRDCRYTKCFTQNFPSGHVYKVHGHTHTFGFGIQLQELLLYIGASALSQNLGRLRYLEDSCFWAFEGYWAFFISLSYVLSVSSPAQLSKGHQFQDQTFLFLAPKAALAQPPML